MGVGGRGVMYIIRIDSKERFDTYTLSIATNIPFP